MPNVRLTWTNNSSGHDGQRVRMDAPSSEGPDTVIADIGPNVEEYIALSATEPEACFTVAAYEGGTEEESAATCVETGSVVVVGYAWSSVDIVSADLSNDDLTITKNSESSRGAAGAEQGSERSSGAWYWEVLVEAMPGLNRMAIGFSVVGYFRGTDLGQGSDSFAYRAEGARYFDGSFSGGVYASYGVGDIIGVALDIDNGTVEFFKNGVSQGEESILLDALEYVPAFSTTITGDSVTIMTTSNQFSYTIPAGFVGLGDN